MASVERNKRGWNSGADQDYFADADQEKNKVVYPAKIESVLSGRQAVRVMNPIAVLYKSSQVKPKKCGALQTLSDAVCVMFKKPSVIPRDKQIGRGTWF